MDLVWNPWALPNLVAGVIIILIALFLVHIGSGRTTNRLLAAVLVFHGLAWGSLGFLYSQSEPHGVFAAQVLFNVTIVPGLLLYPAFLGHALTRAPRFLRSHHWLIGSIACAAILDTIMVVRPEWAIAGVTEVSFAAYDTIPGALMIAYLFLAALVSLTGIALSIYEILGTKKGTTPRTRAKLFLLAFGIQDLLFAAGAVVVVFVSPDSWINILTNVGVGATGSLAASILVSYAIIRHRLFGIEVHLRFAISRSTMAGVFIAVFFVASEAAQQFFGDTIGSTYAGIAAAGALVFAIAPLQRAAERLAERAVPVAATGLAAARRAEEAYRAVLRRYLRGGALAWHEERALAVLAGELRLDAGRAFELREEAERAALAVQGVEARSS